MKFLATLVALSMASVADGQGNGGGPPAFSGNLDSCPKQSNCLKMEMTSTCDEPCNSCSYKVCMWWESGGDCTKTDSFSHVCDKTDDVCQAANWLYGEEIETIYEGRTNEICHTVLAGGVADFVWKDANDCLEPGNNFLISGNTMSCRARESSEETCTGSGNEGRECIWSVTVPDADTCGCGPEPTDAPTDPPTDAPTAEEPATNAPTPEPATDAPTPAPQPTPPAPTGTFGDPHFKSWDGTFFDYMGECDLVLADSPAFANGLGIATHIRTKTRYDYSYVESAAVKIGDDVLEVTAFGDYMLNGVSKAPMPAKMAGFEVTESIKNDHDVTFEIHVSKTETIKVKAFKDLVSVTFTGAHMDGAKGIMGDFKTGNHVARDGVTIMTNHDEFGQEWQVNPEVDGQIFQVKSRIQYPAEKCMLPTPVKTGRRRLGETISVEAASKACEKVGNEDAIAACVYDVIALGDLEAAESGVY